MVGGDRHRLRSHTPTLAPPWKLVELGPPSPSCAPRSPRCAPPRPRACPPPLLPSRQVPPTPSGDLEVVEVSGSSLFCSASLDADVEHLCGAAVETLLHRPHARGPHHLHQPGLVEHLDVVGDGGPGCLSATASSVTVAARSWSRLRIVVRRGWLIAFTWEGRVSAIGRRARSPGESDASHGCQ